MLKNLLGGMLVLLASFALFSPAAFAAEEQKNYIGVYGSRNPNTLRLFDLKGKRVGNIQLEPGVGGPFVDIDPTNPGGEFIDYDYSEDTLSVLKQNGEPITQTDFSIIPNKKNRSFSIAVGDVDPDYDGDEIVLCTRSFRPKMKMYAYSPENGIEHIRTTKPFGESQKNRRGCGRLIIGDIDNDGENEIITRKSQYYGTLMRRLKVFNGDGTLQHQWDLEKKGSDIEGKIFLYDIKNNGKNRLVVHHPKTLDVYGGKGKLLRRIDTETVGLDWGKANSTKLVENIHGKPVFVQLQNGRKGRIAVTRNFSNSDRRIRRFTSYPKAKYKNHLSIIVGPFVVNE